MLERNMHNEIQNVSPNYMYTLSLLRVIALEHDK